MRNAQDFSHLRLRFLSGAVVVGCWSVAGDHTSLAHHSVHEVLPPDYPFLATLASHTSQGAGEHFKNADPDLLFFPLKMFHPPELHIMFT